jgi:ribosomal protein L29
MLTFSEIRQLSDKDINEELKTSRDSLFRQKMGVKTGHLKDNHMVAIIKKYIAQILTEINRRKRFGESVEKTSAEVAKKAADSKAELAKLQEGKKEKAKAKKAEKKVEKVEAEAVDSKDIKVKKVEKKKGLFSRKSKDTEK